MHAYNCVMETLYLLKLGCHVYLRCDLQCQIIGGAVLHDGSIAEMKTGEGKTLVSTLAAYLNALTGEGVHGMFYIPSPKRQVFEFFQLQDMLAIFLAFENWV